MAVQYTITGDAGLDISYWKIESIQGGFNGGEIDLRFTLGGYKDASWRSKEATAKNITFHPLMAGGLSGAAGESTPHDRAANYLNPGNTSGDLRPALYAWLKTQTDWNDFGRSNQTVNWSQATDV